MRELTSHKVNGLNEALLIQVLDEPGDGGACHKYQIESVEKTDLSDVSKACDLTQANCRIHFQNGPIQEAGVNGISNEALLAVVENRLKGFQSGKFACRENAFALTKLQECMMWLHKRTRDRVARGVEGTHEN